MVQKISRFIKFYFPALIWMGVIFYFSSIPSLKYTEEVTPEIILRKSAHFFEFAILTVLYWRIFLMAHHVNFKKSYLFTFFLASLFAASDEFHQTFTPGRSGLFIDFVYDAVSIFLALQLILFFRMRKGKKKIVFSIFIALMILVGMDYKMIQNGKKENKIKMNTSNTVVIEENKIEKEEGIKNNQNLEGAETLETKDQESSKIPENIFIKVPFTTQAPFSNWDELHEEACEEASLVMIKYYLDKKNLDKEISEKEIQSLIAFEKKSYGELKDLNAQEFVKLAEDYYDIANLEVIYDFKLEDIKKYLAKEKPIIIPAAGRLLGNPNFTSPGPLYHNLVLVGYNGNTIITNDPGTRKGEGYEYKIKILYNAIHDFPGTKEEIEKGRKAMIIIE
jgi:VanZ family protein